MAHIEGIVLDVIGLILQQNLIGMFNKGFQSYFANQKLQLHE